MSFRTIIKMRRTLYILFIVSGVECYETAKCATEDRFGNEMWFCCDNHEMYNDTCVECQIGFESFDGSPCQPCQKGKHGRKCGYFCTCLENQICNHILGCIQESRNISTQPVNKNFTTETTIYKSFMSIPVQWLTTPTITVSISHEGSSLGEGTLTTMKSTEKGLLPREIILYSLGVGVLVLVILLCTACHHRYKKLYGSIRKHQTEQNRHILENPLQEFSLEEFGGIYEVIDESNMIENINNNRGDDDSSSDSNENYCQPNDNGYLTPCQPTDDEVNSSNSIEDESESFAEDKKHQNTSDRESTSSSSYIQGGYLNPYQQMVHSADIHEYVLTQTHDDCGSSKTESQLMESGYLILSSDLHKCESIQDVCSSLSYTGSKDIGIKLSHPNQDFKSEIETIEYKSVNGSSSDADSVNLEMIITDSVGKFEIMKEL